MLCQCYVRVLSYRLHGKPLSGGAWERRHVHNLRYLQNCVLAKLCRHDMNLAYESSLGYIVEI